MKRKNVIGRGSFTLGHLPGIVLVVVAHDANIALNAYHRRFPRDEKAEGRIAYTVSSQDGDFGLFFSVADLDEGILAHELDHLGDFIEEYIGETKKPDEHGAYLKGHLTKRTRRIITRIGVKIKP